MKLWRRMFVATAITIPLLIAISFMIVYLMRSVRLFGIDIEDLYKELNDGKITSDSILTFKIESNGCTLLGKYAGPDYRLIESVGSNEACQKYTFKDGDDPDEFTGQLVKADLMSDNILRS